MNTILKRVISLVLCFVLVAGYLPTDVLAAETGETVTAEATEVTTEPPQAASEETEAPLESTDATEPSSEATEPSKKATEPSAEATEPSTEATEPSTEATEPDVIAVTGITLDKTTVEVGVGELPMTLVATVLPEDATDKTVTWTSSEPGVVSVENGELTFGYMGEAVITATAGEFSASCTVKVGEGEASWYEYTGPDYLDAAIFCSDVHGSSSDLTSTMSGVATSGVYYSSIGFVGDTCLTVAKTESAVNSGLGYTPTVMFSYASSHDTENSADISTNWNYSGEVENVSDYYLVYTIREDDMKSDTGADDAFTSWYDGLTDAEKKLPIFIMSHRPLHDRRDDNAGAAGWYSVISAAAESSDITFFWAHNHTSESSVDTAAYYVAKDGTETFTVYQGNTVVPNFTYMNAGYINANNQNPKRIGVATTVRITADSLIFQDYNASGEYTDSSYSHNVTVAREFAAEEATLISIAVSGTNAYYVGDTLALTVTATYSDGTTKDVTAEASLSGYDMTAAGTYTVKAEYEGMTAEYTITVSAPVMTKIEITTQPTTVIYDKGDELSTEGMVVTATYDNGTTADVTDKAYVFGTVDMTTAGEKTVTIAYSDNGTIFKATYTITVNDTLADDMVLTALEITTAPAKTEYLLNDALDITGMVVKATFSDGTSTEQKELTYAGFINSEVEAAAADTYAYYIDGFNMHVEKHQTVTVSYSYGGVTKTATFTINVWNADFADETTGVKVSVAGGDYGVTAVSVAESTNENVSAAIAEVISGTNYKAWDITLTLDADVNANGEAVYTLTEGEKTVTLPIPSGVNNPVVYYVSDDGATVTNMNAVKDGNGNVTFTTTHFSTYVIGESTEITVPENSTATGSGTTTTTEKKTIYKLVSSLTAGEEYLIVSRNTAGSGYGLAGSTTGQSVTVKAADDVSSVVYIEDKGNALEWTAASGWKFSSGSYNLGVTQSGGSRSLSFSTSSDWTLGTNQLYYQGNQNSYYLACSSGTWSVSRSSTSSRYAYFYQKTEVDVETTTTVPGTYAIEGQDLSAAVAKDSTANLTATLTFTPTDGTATTTDVSTTATYEVVTVDASGNTVNGDPDGIISKIENGVVTFTGNYGTALVKVSYTTDFGTVTDYITVEATAPYYTIDLCDPVTDDEGNTTYEPITKPVALKGVKAGDTYSVWAVVKEHNSENPDGVDLGELGEALTWSVSDTSIATIDTATGVITFTGTNYGIFAVKVAYTGADGKVITDEIIISVTESLYVVPGDGTDDFPEYPNEGAVRFDKTATAVGNFSETGIAKVELSMTGVPYSTGSEIDVVVMLDMTGSMSDNGMEAAEEATKAFMRTIVINEDGTYNDNRIAVYAFNSGSSSPYELVALKTIKSDAELEAADTAIDTASDKQASGGTPYDEAAKQCYDVLQAAKTDGTGDDRQQFCLFMSDGGPTTYEGSDGYLYYGGNDTSGDRAITSYISGYTSSTASDWSFNLPTEYYTDLMKADGVTVYTVGLLLQNAPSNPAPWSSMTDSTYDSTTDSLTTIGSHYYFTSTLLKNMATSSAHYIDIFSVDTADDATAKFQSIAQKIVEAAKDVVVEDKIGSNYSVNFSVPGYGTGNVVSEDALDGTTEFYIQVVEYQLNSDKERTGDPYVKENFTFNADGTLKSHTVDGVACESCAHVTTTNGVITAIDGTYFDYKSDSTGEYLTWEEDKISTTELALQYFVYLDSSSGVDPDDQIAAGTYYTNEYATLTYTNYKDNQVQQEFPIPQMTWNGAQVSYVFYLVNEAGQPVNRAGRVVPFAEAVYVTDVYTYSVIWNDLEQSAGLEARYLAETLVPDVYALYDDDATYQIHVYEDESEVNLNNHFIIGGDVTDAYNTTEHSWTNVKTTYVFNNKSDATKYNEVGAYIANDGNDSSDSNAYYCKSAAIANAAYETSTDAAGVTVYKVTSVGDGYQNVDGETQVLASALKSTTGGTIIDGYVYYVDENGAVYTIVQKTDGKEVEQGFDFSNTTVAFAVVWKPELVEDTVVVDYGLDVVIDVITNDNMAAGVVGVRADKPDAVINSGSFTADKVQSVDVYIDSNNDGENLKENKIGTASVQSLNQVRFSLDDTNGMQFTDPAVFYYEADVNYYDSNNELQTTSMYSSVTVIPATTVYYEDDFLTLASYTKSGDAWAEDETSKWSSSVQNGVQDQDRPGASKITAALDADNNYGYDSAYETMSTHSLNNSAHITVDADTRGEATFTFYGTGFDVISTTSNTTGTLTVQVYSGTEATGAAVKTSIVDTYYGMDADGNISLNTPDAIYQVPVMKIFGLTYGQYTVKITAAYNQFFDHDNGGSYDLYLDAIRIYDPTGNLDETANDAYVADGEAWPTYVELRDKVIEASSYSVTENEDGTVSVTGELAQGVVFIDCSDGAQLADYVSYGPNNELYLANNQAVAFTVTDADIADIQLGIKVANGGSVTYEINGDSYTVETTTDMYYSILDYAKDGQTVVIQNVRGGILSLTNIKVTHTTAPADASGVSLLSMDADSVGYALMSLRAPVVEEVPETTVPEETEPEETVPETSEPEATDPETEPTEPEEDTYEEVTVEKVVETVKKIVKKLFGWFFG